MKVGVDAVILGAWADLESARSVLDVGCGCGVIALMAAQRNSIANIQAIDIDVASVQESEENFKSSPWSGRLNAELCDFNVFANDCQLKPMSRFDYIISNPPYFDSGVEYPESVRLKARHQAEFSPSILLEKGSGMLSANGKIGMVVPFDQYYNLKSFASKFSLYSCRLLIMTGREGRCPKRAFVEFIKGSIVEEKIGTLTIEHTDGSFTSEYISLCRDFYLNF